MTKAMTGSFGIHFALIVGLTLVPHALVTQPEHINDLKRRAVPIYVPRIERSTRAPRVRWPARTLPRAADRVFVAPFRPRQSARPGTSLEELAGVSLPQVSLAEPQMAGWAAVVAPPTLPPPLAVSAGFRAARAGAGQARGNGLGGAPATFPSALPSGGTGSGGGNGATVPGGFPPAGSPPPPFPDAVRAVVPVFRAARITEMPRPEYTEAARSRRIQGYILVRIILCADGRVLVKGIVASKGINLKEAFGLDQSAVSAAQQIKFIPALQDQTITVRADFQLAYSVLSAHAQIKGDSPNEP
jgi:TonB family protein